MQHGIASRDARVAMFLIFALNPTTGRAGPPDVRDQARRRTRTAANAPKPATSRPNEEGSGTTVIV